MKQLTVWIVSAVFLMLFCPCLVAAYAGGAGMAICLLLFFALNPLFSLLCGAAAGKNLKRLWYLPLITAALFLAGAWLFFELWETAFLLYSGCYLLIGIVAMLLTAFMNSRKH